MRWWMGWLIPAACVVAVAAEAVCSTGLELTAPMIGTIPDIDGDLSDWPKGIDVQRIGGTAPATFRVAWSPETDRIYVALEVTDDTPATGDVWSETDAADVYTWGGDPREATCVQAGIGAPVQFAVVPGDGEYSPGCGNPCALTAMGHQEGTARGLEVAWERDGDTITYEWAVPVFEDSGTQPSIALEPGRTVGFDILITDNDDGRYRWAAWGNPQGQKFESADRLGMLTLEPWPAGLMLPEPAMRQAATILRDLGGVQELDEAKLERLEAEAERLEAAAERLAVGHVTPDVMARIVSRVRGDVRVVNEDDGGFRIVTRNVPGGASTVLLWGLLVVAVGLAVYGVRGRRAAGERLDTIERRLTDTQDVLLALNEKCERLEQRLASPRDEPSEGGA